MLPLSTIHVSPHWNHKVSTHQCLCMTSCSCMPCTVQGLNVNLRFSFLCIYTLQTCSIYVTTILPSATPTIHQQLAHARPTMHRICLVFLLKDKREEGIVERGASNIHSKVTVFTLNEYFTKRHTNPQVLGTSLGI